MMLTLQLHNFTKQEGIGVAPMDGWTCAFACAYDILNAATMMWVECGNRWLRSESWWSCLFATHSSLKLLE